VRQSCRCCHRGVEGEHLHLEAGDQVIEESTPGAAPLALSDQPGLNHRGCTHEPQPINSESIAKGWFLGLSAEYGDDG